MPAGRDHPGRLFVGGLPFHVNDGTLREAFQIYGQIIDVKVRTLPLRRRRRRRASSPPPPASFR